LTNLELLSKSMPSIQYNYMKFISAILLFLVLSGVSYSQDMKTFKLYKPTENADSALNVAIEKAGKEGKHVFVQIGGNWCVWCARFNEFVTKDTQLDSAVNKNYVVYHLNYSPENINKSVMARFSYPQRFGFPVFIVLDGKGKQLHIQNSAYLELAKSYNKERVLEFFDHWSPKSLDPAQYKNY